MESYQVLKEAFESPNTSPKEIASELGVSLSLIYKWAQPHTEQGSGSPNPLDRVDDLIRLTRHTGIVEWLCQRAGGYFVRNPKSPGSKRYQVVPATHTIVQQFAGLLDAVSRAAQDNSITAEESAEIARCFGVPLLLIGAPSSQTASSSESLINFWLSTALGSRLENIEATLERALGLSASERIEFDEKALLRTDLAGRMEAYSKGVQGGIYVPNEALGFEGLPPVSGGGSLFMQRQMTPVDLLTELAANELKAPEPAPAPPAPEPEPEESPDESGAKVLHLMTRKRA
jgi:transposase